MKVTPIHNRNMSFLFLQQGKVCTMGTDYAPWELILRVIDEFPLECADTQ